MAIGDENVGTFFQSLSLPTTLFVRLIVENTRKAHAGAGVRLWRSPAPAMSVQRGLTVRPEQLVPLVCE